ncbi:hypothetical protein SARC_13311 [Sphaeroforma arctica JP610]|uniref:Polygalacturonase n=1 Tax=Sphaeroforma arctica JP610 TaxID=667725 RepID=A0A0L0FBK0_9EUKA|nr:hypothetical protein SARC_13311 [Sphaeroforma arctica JP610]KNC74132.1 hypothetical protein SARC_13311 [Sphaeroforma arctica JP610]|eukprot:XP_014148034.1 hypothetical protein SARC_13311 [Sphaeroforma arctica JP610]
MTKKHASLINIGRCLELSSAPSNVGGKSKKLDDMCLDWEKNRNVTIEGDGTIDGAGMAWWEEKGALRPTLVGPIFVDGLVLHGIKLINSAFWTVHPLFCNDVSITDVDINAPSDSPNTDGIDPDSCTNVYIARCKISVGDDCIAIKSGRDAAARRIGKPTQNVLVEDMAFGQCHGLTIGSEMSGGVQNVTIRNSVSTNSKRGYPLIRIKTRQGRGSYVRDVTFSNITADFATYLMRVDMFYPPQPARGKYPIISDITVKDITLQRAFGVWLFECLDTAPCRNFHLEGNSVTTFDKGFYGKNVYGTATNNEPAIELNPMQGSMQMQLDEELEKAARKE